jgi:hypothetical protein
MYLPRYVFDGGAVILVVKGVKHRNNCLVWASTSMLNIGLGVGRSRMYLMRRDRIF